MWDINKLISDAEQIGEEEQEDEYQYAFISLNENGKKFC